MAADARRAPVPPWVPRYVPPERDKVAPEELEDPSGLPDHVAPCTVCMDIPLQPVAVCGNAHYFCLGCVTALAACPNCKERTQHPRRAPRIVSTTLAKIKARCRHDPRHVVPLSSLAGHEMCCPQRKVPCDSCGVFVAVSRMPAHQEDVCPKRMVRCDRMCHEMVPWDELGTHDCTAVILKKRRWHLVVTSASGSPNSMDWVRLGREGGDHVEGSLHTPADCFVQAVRKSCTNAIAWVELARLCQGEDTLYLPDIATPRSRSREPLDRKGCLLLALAADPEYPAAWGELGFVGERLDASETPGELPPCSPSECFVRAISCFRARAAEAWEFVESSECASWIHAALMLTRQGRLIDRQRIVECLELDSSKSSYWYVFGTLGGGNVCPGPRADSSMGSAGGRSERYTPQGCFQMATSLANADDDTMSASWYELGKGGGALIMGVEHTAVSCFGSAIRCNRASFLAWHALGQQCEMEDIVQTELQGKHYTPLECYIEALSHVTPDAEKCHPSVVASLWHRVAPPETPAGGVVIIFCPMTRVDCLRKSISIKPTVLAACDLVRETGSISDGIHATDVGCRVPVNERKGVSDAHFHVAQLTETKGRGPSQAVSQRAKVQYGAAIAKRQWHDQTLESQAWMQLYELGGASIPIYQNGTLSELSPLEYTRDQCLRMSLQLQPINPRGWKMLAEAGGGEVGLQTLTKAQCMDRYAKQSSSMESEPPRSIKRKRAPRD